MKRVMLVFVFAIGAFFTTPMLSAQDNSNGMKPDRAEKKRARLEKEKEQASRMSELIAQSHFVLEPNQISGFNVNPVLNFLMLSGDTLIFQTSRPTDRTRSGNLLTDKTVMARVTSKEVKSNPKTGYQQLKLRVMTQVGVGFRIDLKISPFGNATAWISSNNSGSTLEFRGPVVSPEQSNISIGAESFDLNGFPWFFNIYTARWDERADF